MQVVNVNIHGAPKARDWSCEEGAVFLDENGNLWQVHHNGYTYALLTVNGDAETNGTWSGRKTRSENLIAERDKDFLTKLPKGTEITLRVT